MGICGESNRKKNIYEKPYYNSNNNKESNLDNSQKKPNSSVQSKGNQPLNTKNIFSK